MCGNTVEMLKRHPNFPGKPHYVGFLSNLQSKYRTINYAQRLIGFIHPPADGKYKFALASRGCSEMHMSLDPNPKNAQLVVKTCKDSDETFVDQDNFSARQSKALKLHSGKKYYFDVLHKAGEGQEHLQVAWSRDNGPFEVVSGKFLSAYEDVHVGQILSRSAVDGEWEVEQVFEQEQFEDPKVAKFVMPTYYSDSELKDMLPSCSWSPSYARPHHVSQYQAANNYVCKMRFAILGKGGGVCGGVSASASCSCFVCA